MACHARQCNASSGVKQGSKPRLTAVHRHLLVQCACAQLLLSLRRGATAAVTTATTGTGFTSSSAGVVVQCAFKVERLRCRQHGGEHGHGIHLALRRRGARRQANESHTPLAGNNWIIPANQPSLKKLFMRHARHDATNATNLCTSPRAMKNATYVHTYRYLKPDRACKPGMQTRPHRRSISIPSDPLTCPLPPAPPAPPALDQSDASESSDLLLPMPLTKRASGGSTGALPAQLHHTETNAHQANAQARQVHNDVSQSKVGTHVF